jgi:hypothetical protein
MHLDLRYQLINARWDFRSVISRKELSQRNFEELSRLGVFATSNASGRRWLAALRRSQITLFVYDEGTVLTDLNQKN